jgi:hypothetical protein
MSPLAAVTSGGSVLRLANLLEIPARSPGAGTVALIRLAPGTTVVGAGPAPEGAVIWAKEHSRDRAATVDAKHFSPQGRNGQGRKYPGLSHIEVALIGPRGAIGTREVKSDTAVPLRLPHKLRPAKLASWGAIANPGTTPTKPAETQPNSTPVILGLFDS